MQVDSLKADAESESCPWSFCRLVAWRGVARVQGSSCSELLAVNNRRRQRSAGWQRSWSRQHFLVNRVDKWRRWWRTWRRKKDPPPRAVTTGRTERLVDSGIIDRPALFLVVLASRSGLRVPVEKLGCRRGDAKEKKRSGNLLPLLSGWKREASTRFGCEQQREGQRKIDGDEGRLRESGSDVRD